MTELAKRLRAAFTRVAEAQTYSDAARAIDLLAQLVVKNGNEILAAFEREPDEAMVEREAEAIDQWIGDIRASREMACAAIAAMQTQQPETQRKFALGDRVRKKKGSQWRGRVVGFYSASLTAEGYAIESEMEPGNVQVYPVAALERWDGS